MAIMINGLLICTYFFLLMIKQLSLACICASYDNYSSPTPLTFTEHGAGGQSTTCSYNLNGYHYYCVYDSNGKLIQDNDLGYCPKPSIGGCAQTNGMCPAKDAHGTALTDTIPNNDGSVTCAFGSAACLYDTNGKLLEDQNSGACPSTAIDATTTTAKPTNRCPTNDTHGTTLTNTNPQNDGTLVCVYGSGACHYDSTGKLMEDQDRNACPSITGPTGEITTTRSTTNQTVATAMTARAASSDSLTTTTTTVQNPTTTTTSQTFSITMTTRTPTTSSMTTTITQNPTTMTTSQTLSTTVTTRTTTMTTQNPIIISTTSQTVSITITQNSTTATTSRILSTTMTTRTTTTSSMRTTTTQNPTTTTTSQTLSTTTTIRSTTTNSITTTTIQNPTATTTSQTLSTTITRRTTTTSSMTTTTTQNPTSTTMRQIPSTTTTARITTSSSTTITATQTSSITSTTSQTVSATVTTRTTTNTTQNSITMGTSQTVSTTITARTTTTTQNPTITSTISKTVSATVTTRSTTTSSMTATTNQNRTTITTTIGTFSTTSTRTQNLPVTTTTGTVATTMTTQTMTIGSRITTMTQNPIIITTTSQSQSTMTATTAQSVISDYYIEFYFPLNVTEDNITDTMLASQLTSIFTTALGTTSNQINIIVTTERSRTTNDIVAQVRLFSTMSESADALFARTQQQLADPTSPIRQQSLTTQLTENSIQDVRRFYICSNGVVQDSPCNTVTTQKPATSLSVVLVVSIVPSVIGVILLIVAGYLIVRYVKYPSLQPRVSRFDRF